MVPVCAENLFNIFPIIAQVCEPPKASQSEKMPIEVVPTLVDSALGGSTKRTIEGTDVGGLEYGRLLEEAVNNGTLERALSTPANPVPTPLKSCPGMSVNILKKEIKQIFDDSLASGGMSLHQAEHLRDVLSTYNRLLAERQAESDALVIIDYSSAFNYKPPERSSGNQPTQLSLSAAQKVDEKLPPVDTGADLESDLQID